MDGETQQSALANTYELAQMLHKLRGLSSEVELLLSDAIKHAHTTGLTQSLIADATGLTRGRINQIAKDGQRSQPLLEVEKRTSQILQWPSDALLSHSEDFAGRMTMPPYPRRRPSPTTKEES